MKFSLYDGAMEIWLRGINDIQYRFASDEPNAMDDPWEPLASIDACRLFPSHADALIDQTEAVGDILRQFKGHGLNELPDELVILLCAMRRLLLIELSHGVYDKQRYLNRRCTEAIAA